MFEFNGYIFGAVQPGQVYILSGRTIDIPSEFHLNLRNYKYEEDTYIPLNLSVFFRKGITVRNTYTPSERWGVEELEQNLLSSWQHPIVPGELFKIFILVSDQHFYIAINDVPYCTYKFRLNLNVIKIVEITGDIQSIVQFDQRSVFPTLYPYIPIQLQPNGQRLEFSSDISEKITKGHVTVITAIPYGNPNGSFIIYLTEGVTPKQALHFHAIFHPQYVVVQNAMSDNLCFPYELNETSGSFPFKINKKFRLAICFTDTEFKFAVNGAIFNSFKYRSPNLLGKLNGFQISGGNELRMRVTTFNHITSGPANGDGFEKHSQLFD